MRSALQCIFFALIIGYEGSRAVPEDDFRPTPIPIDKWHDKHERNFGTLQEIVATESPPTVAAIPAHYWEDALRHSVYLTLVRDKIDQLIAKGAVQSESNKHEPTSKEDDDRDMWEKIKSAPFDRLVQETGAPLGDFSVIAKGRLLEENNGYRFAEDETTREKCRDEKCMRGVKAFWSVKRVRQRDSETHPGKYHYELTFSVTSQTSKKQRKPYDNPVRTFTVRENNPEPENIHVPINSVRRPQREVWVHKNIVPTRFHESRQYNHGLDRFFSSIFSEDDTYEPPKYKQQNSFMRQPFLQLSKAGNVDSFEEQRKLVPYPYKPQLYKNSRHPLPAPPPSNIQPYVDFDGMFNNRYPYTQEDHRNLPSNIIKTTRPAFLPTPLPAIKPVYFPQKNNFTTNTISYKNILENNTQAPEFGKTNKNYNRPKPTPAKVNYFTDHVRPPIFNAPPGVFVTMDNKPFKPMPPLKLMHPSKSTKSKPLNFRPSPQVLDAQFSDSDSLPDSAFKPITLGYTDYKPENNDFEASNKKRKPSTSTKKTTKGLENIKSHQTTTSVPDIITAHSGSFEEDDTMEWANLLGAFTKTTPMASQKNKTNTTTTMQTSSTTPTHVTKETTTEAVTTTTTTVKPTKRTRPPPKFTKPNKIKKHKRVTTSTTTTTTTDIPKTTTVKARSQDLIPQASSAATNDKPTWKSKNQTLSTTPLTTSTNTVITSTKPTTTTKESTTTEQTTPFFSSTSISTTSIATIDANPVTTQPKYKNRYRQSTLMQKGTSVKHDRWSMPMTEKNKTNVSHKPTRRKESNFQGYSSTTSRTLESEQNNKDLIGNVSNLLSTVNNTRNTTTIDVESTSQFQSNYEDSVDQYETVSETPSINMNVKEKEPSAEKGSKENKEHDTKDENEFIFNVTSIPIEKSNEIEQDIAITTEQTVITSTKSVTNNKTRCKKRKPYNTTTITTTTTAEDKIKDHQNLEHEVTTISNTITSVSFTTGLIDELLRSINTDPSVETKETIQSVARGDNESTESFTHNDDEFEEFLDVIEGKHHHHDEEISEEIYDDDDNGELSIEHSPFDNDEENRAVGSSNDDYNDYQDHPYTIFELMAME